MKFKFMDGLLVERERLSVHLQDISQPSRIGSQAIVRSILLTMRISTVLLISALHLSAAGLSQKITFAGTNVPLSAVFNAIEEQTGYGVIMSHANLATAKPVTVAFKDATLDEVLTKCFSFQEAKFRYSITGHTISIAKVESIVVAAPSTAEPLGGRPPEFIGVVSSEDGKPLVGATVEILKLNKRGLTNLKGEFSFSQIPDGKYKVEITFVGFEKYQTFIEVGESPVKLMIGLKVSNSKLDDVQVIAYGMSSQRLNTGDVTTIKAKDIEEQPVSNPIMSLEGRVPGLVITQASGLPGAGITVQIRGQNSIGYGNDPFYVIDGVPYPSQLLPNFGGVLGFSGTGNGNSGSPLSFLNPDDIESISVLKDASATAIYGSRAANGAILITTKKGKAGKTRGSFNLQSGWSHVTKTIPMLNLRQYLAMRHEAIQNDGLSVQPTDYDINGLWDSTRSTDWQKVLIGNSAQYTNLNVSLSGGDAYTQYLIGSTYNRQTTVFPGNFVNQSGSLHCNINSATPNQKLRIVFSGSYTVNDNRIPLIDPSNRAVLFAPDAPPLHNSDGSLNWGPTPSGSSSWFNPLSYLYNIYNNTTRNLVSNTVLSYQVFPGLEIRSSLGYTNLHSDEIATYPLVAVQPESRSTTSRLANYANNNMSSWIVEPQAAYKAEWGRGKLEALLGTTFTQSMGKGYQLQGLGYNSDQVLEDIRSAATLSVNSSTAFQYKYNAVFARLNYHWQDRYILDLTGRRDGSSRFGSANQFHNFGAAGVGWIFSQENLIRHVLPALSFGKLRASYGTTGNDQIGDYTFMDLYYPNGVDIPYQGLVGLSPGGLSNPFLQWESTRKLEFGTELGFAKDRILLTASYFQNRSSNQLLPYNLSALTGFVSILKNFPAIVQNAGGEFTLSTINIRAHNFSWSSHLNLTIPRNKLIAFPNVDQTGYQYSLVVGKSVSIIHVYHFLGVNPETGVYEFGTNHGISTTAPDTNSVANAYIILDPTPRYYGGFQNTIRYKGFELDFLIQFTKQIGPNYFFGNGVAPPGSLNNGLSNQPAWVLSHWQKLGDIATHQRFNSNYLYSQQNGDAIGSDAAWSDASYIRLKNVSLSWQMPEQWLKKVHVQNLQVFLHTQNLITITHYLGGDPETKSVNSLGPMKTITMGIHVTL